MSVEIDVRLDDKFNVAPVCHVFHKFYDTYEFSLSYFHSIHARGTVRKLTNNASGRRSVLSRRQMRDSFRRSVPTSEALIWRIKRSRIKFHIGFTLAAAIKKLFSVKAKYLSLLRRKDRKARFHRLPARRVSRYASVSDMNLRL